MRKTYKSFYDFLRRFYPKCQHSWRPARTSFGSAKHCDVCGTTEQIGEADFYALFGRTSRWW